MATTPIEYLASLRIGTVEYISPDRIEVQLDIESPESVAVLSLGRCRGLQSNVLLILSGEVFKTLD